MRVASMMALLIPVCFISLTANAADDKWECANGAMKREVQIDYEGSGKKAPCHVVYKKDSRSEEAATTLWSADNDSSFCEAKAKAFIEKLKGLGWTCP